MHRHNRNGLGNINLEIDDDNENYINIDYIDKNNEDIEKNKNEISPNLKKINNIKNDMRNKIYDETFNLENQKFSISSGQNIKLFSIDIDHSFLNKNYTIEINTSFHYLKTNNVNGINHKYVIFDKKTHAVYGKKTFYKNNYHNGKIIIDHFETTPINNINEKKLQVDCYVTNLSGKDKYLELNNNSMAINCFENYDFLDIYKNKEDIASNLSEINNSKSYLKNVYNLLFYKSKTQIDFRNNFYNKTFELNANKNDFIEMKFKIDLQYEDISERNYVKTIYQLFDENDNSL